MGNSDSNLSQNIEDALRELGNVGAGNAVTSFSVLLNSKITMSRPIVKICNFDDFEKIIGSYESVVCAVFSTVEGGFEAIIAFLLTLDDAKTLVKIVLGEDAEWDSELGISAISEIANILIGTYVSSLETLTNTKIRYSLPEICIDMAGAILSVPYVEYSQIGDKSLLIDSDFEVGKYKIDGKIMLISYTDSYDILLEKLGIVEA